jgi:hypothetical protein
MKMKDYELLSAERRYEGAELEGRKYLLVPS